MECNSVRRGPNVKALASELDGVLGSNGPQQQPQFVVQRQFTQNTVQVAVPNRRETVQVIRLSPRLRPKNNNASSVDSDPFSSDFEHLIGDDDCLSGSVIDTDLDSLDWEHSYNGEDVVWEEHGNFHWDNNVSYLAKANGSDAAATPQLRPTDVNNRKASGESDVVEEVFEQPERLPPFPPLSPAAARTSPSPSTPSPPPPLLPPSPPPPFVPPLQESGFSSDDDDTFQVSSYQSSLTPSSQAASHVTSTDTIPYIDDAASGRTASTGSRDSTPTPAGGLDEYPEAPPDDYQYSYSAGRRNNAARSRGASYENVDIVRYTIATAATQKSVDKEDEDNRKFRPSANESVDEVHDTLKRDKPAARKMDDPHDKVTSDDSHNTSVSSRSSSYMQTDQWSPEIKVEAPQPISDDNVFSPTAPIALSTCYQECMAVKVPMFRSQSARITRTSCESVEPPRRQSEIVRAVRPPSYENANTFQVVRRPNSFDVEDLRRNPSSPPTEHRRQQHIMATFSSPSPKKEPRRSQNAPPTLAPISINTKTEPRLSPYIATSTTTFTNSTFAPAASPEVTSPGDSGYGYAFSPEQSPRENSLPQIRESSDDSDSAETGSPRPVWDASPSPKIAENSMAATKPVKPVKKRDSGRQASRNRSQEEEENERNGSEDSYYSDSDFDENDSSGSSLGSRESVPSQRGEAAAAYTDEITPDSLADTAADLLVSERTYVDHLHFLCRVVLLDLKVLSKVQDVHSLPPATIEQLFPSIDTIFNFHACNFLPRLEERLTVWDQKGYICDIVKDLLSFLVVYQRYVENIKKSIKMIDTFRNTHPVFAALLDEVEKVPECRRLPVKQHMMDIAQRVSTYRDFLKDYDSSLPNDAEEKPDIKEALESITRTAYDIERTLGREERMKILKEMQRRLDTSVNFVTPTGELIKEGKIKAISSQTNKKADRYMFLLNEALLICTTAGIGGKHKLKYVIDVDGMQIYDGDNLHLPSTFYVHGRKKTIELQASSAEQKHEWVKRIRQVIDEFTTRKLSKSLTLNYAVSPDDVGKVKPVKATTSGVSACPTCGAQFKGTKRKHHCKACGQVVCAKCCTQKTRLEFADFRMCKVCDECYVIIRQRELRLGGDSWVTSPVEAEEPGIVSGYLLLSADRGRSWNKRWLVVHTNAMMYCFKTNKDKSPFTSLPIRRFTVSATRKEDPIHKNNSFKLHNMKKVYYFQAPDTNSTLSWLKVLGDRPSVSE